jgi:hypothetical protein
MHPQLALMNAQQHIAELRRAADRDRLAQAATTAGGSDTPTAGRREPDFSIDRGGSPNGTRRDRRPDLARRDRLRSWS